MSQSGSGDESPAFVSVGGAMVDWYYRLSNLPEPDGGSFVRDAWRDFGGAAANVACTVARLGTDVGMITRLGVDDRTGGYEGADAVEADLRDRKIDVERVRRGDETGTYSMILAGPDGGRMVVTGGESVRSLRLREDDRTYLREAGVAFTNAYAPDPVVEELVAAREDGDLQSFAFDLSGPLPELEGRGVRPGTIDDLVQTADLFVTGDVARQSYCEHLGIDPGVDSTVAHLQDRGVRRAALTHGEDGSTLVTADDAVHVDAVDVDPVDTTGAGDAFIGGLVDAWCFRDRPPREAGRFAAAVAATNCLHEGARGGLPTREAVQSLLDGGS